MSASFIAEPDTDYKIIFDGIAGYQPGGDTSQKVNITFGEKNTDHVYITGITME